MKSFRPAVECTKARALRYKIKDLWKLPDEEIFKKKKRMTSY
jgi:hypothetical protein